MSSISYPSATRARIRAARVTRLLARPELLGVLGLTAALNLSNLPINGWANTYYSAAVRSMSTSWHDFLFASLDKTGLMTLDKPPLALWVQALSVRVFGYHPLSLLVPQALMGIAAVGLLYDLVARRFGRVAGAVGGLAMATTPTVVAIARHNNPDELLVLCCVAAVWFALRALDTGRTKWLVLSGVCVGLGFETKMGVALLVVPGIAAAWLWVAPRGRLLALRELLAGGLAMAVTGLAWPLLVTLTPASDRPWISGTSDNSVWSLIFGYNGLGRVTGQTGGPPGGGFGGAMFGGSAGPGRLLNSALGDQGGWLLGFALVSGLALLVLSRLSRRDPRTGWLIVVGGAFASIAVTFSFASGIFHPYYVSQLAPFAAALVGAGVGTLLSEGRAASVIAPLALAAGAVTEVVVLSELNGRLAWAKPLVIAVALGAAIMLATRVSARMRGAVLGVALAALLVAPAAWAAETLGHAESSTFPAGGPASVGAGTPPALGAPSAGPPPGIPAGPLPGIPAGPLPGIPAGPPPGIPAGGGFGPPGSLGGDSRGLNAAIAYARSHGGGTVGVESQSAAADAILSSGAAVAGLGGFTGRESAVSVRWVAAQVSAGRLSWVLVEGNQGGPRLPGDTRTGSQAAINAIKKSCPAVELANGATLYRLTGRAAAILAAAGE